MINSQFFSCLPYANFSCKVAFDYFYFFLLVLSYSFWTWKYPHIGLLYFIVLYEGSISFVRLGRLCLWFMIILAECVSSTKAGDAKAHNCNYFIWLTIYSKNGVKYPRSMKAPPPMKNPIPPVISAIQKSINPGFNIYTYLRFFFIP